ncbi:MAG TPA: DUF2293 domain-containing protein [Aridibacter sp.]|nr:DUF2293 domain-containing protein [Aridibacter sp.]
MEKSSRYDKSDIAVFCSARETVCEECGTDILKGQFFRVEKKKALCLECADMDHLVFLPSGDAALTRRAGKHSTLKAKVLKFSRARKRYERQGTLVEEEALERAEQECLEDEDARAIRREREAERREKLDQKYVEEFGRKIREVFPNCPHGTARSIAEHACRKYSGRVGRSAAAKEFDETMIGLAVRAHVRHRHTKYDRLLAEGWDRGEARRAVKLEVEDVIESWTGSDG